MRRRLLLLCCLSVSFIDTVLVSAQATASDPKLYGRWGSKRVIGSVCRSQIREIEYLFTDDYIYEIDASMLRMGRITRERASGTYTLQGSMITGLVDGQTVGPFHYRFSGEQLVIEQSNPACTIYLEKKYDR